jgi:hypothetical protein
LYQLRAAGTRGTNNDLADSVGNHGTAKSIWDSNEETRRTQSCAKAPSPLAPFAFRFALLL